LGVPNYLRRSSKDLKIRSETHVDGSNGHSKHKLLHYKKLNIMRRSKIDELVKESEQAAMLVAAAADFKKQISRLFRESMEQ